MAVGIAGTADAELAQRDRALPGLEVLLDDERLTTVLDEALPHAHLRRAEVSYLRYKPATNCLARCRLTVAGGSLEAYVRLERRSALGKLEKHARKVTAGSPGSAIAPCPRTEPAVALRACFSSLPSAERRSSRT